MLHTSLLPPGCSSACACCLSQKKNRLQVADFLGSRSSINLACQVFAHRALFNLAQDNADRADQHDPFATGRALHARGLNLGIHSAQLQPQEARPSPSPRVHLDAIISHYVTVSSSFVRVRREHTTAAQTYPLFSHLPPQK